MNDGNMERAPFCARGGPLNEERILTEVLDNLSDDDETVECLYWMVNNDLGEFAGPTAQPGKKHPTEYVSRADIMRIAKRCHEAGFVQCLQIKCDPGTRERYAEVTERWDENCEGDLWFRRTDAGERERDRLWEKLSLDDVYRGED